MKLEKLNIAGWIAALAVGLFAGASPGHAQTSDRSIRPFTVQCPRPRSMTCAGASLRRAGPIAKLSRTSPRVCSSKS